MVELTPKRLQHRIMCITAPYMHCAGGNEISVHLPVCVANRRRQYPVFFFCMLHSACSEGYINLAGTLRRGWPRTCACTRDEVGCNIESSAARPGRACRRCIHEEHDTCGRRRYTWCGAASIYFVKDGDKTLHKKGGGKYALICQILDERRD